MDEEEQRQTDRWDKLNLKSASNKCETLNLIKAKHLYGRTIIIHSKSLQLSLFWSWCTCVFMMCVGEHMCSHHMCEHTCTIMGLVLSLYPYVSSGTSTQVSRLARQMPIPCQPELNILKQEKGIYSDIFVKELVQSPWFPDKLL